ncbi:MAG: hypothetical protein A2Y92_00780 [Chloroflexi bacterium RBG_13_57_8]|nr:MAG: hypothetical protein A2Y92_00780 [Chloroflexi bacterium RBG_13_57_8]
MRDLSRYCSIPFRDMGPGWDGCDCWGLVLLFYKTELGIDLQSHGGEYAGVKDMASITKIAEAERKKWSVVDPPGMPGDVVEMPLLRRGFHVGVVAAPGLILHIEENGFARVVPEKSFRVASRIKRYWRYNAGLR